jgi:hypothetical protein
VVFTCGARYAALFDMALGNRTGHPVIRILNESVELTLLSDRFSPTERVERPFTAKYVSWRLSWVEKTVVRSKSGGGRYRRHFKS